MKNIVKKETIIGACVLIALLVLFFGIEFLKGVSLVKPSNYYYAVYTDVMGLTTSSQVKVNGVKIGKVNDVKIMPDNPGLVLVEFSIDKGFKLPVNSSATIVSDVLGTPSVRLDLSKDANYYSTGDTIPSKISGGLMDTAGEMLPKIESIIPKIDSLMVNLNNLTGNPALMKTIDNLQSFTAGLQTTLSLVNGSASKILPILSDVQSITANIDSLSVNLAKLSEGLANAPIDETIANLNSVSENISKLTSELNNPESNIGKLLNGTELYDNLIHATADIDSLIVDIKKNPKRYISIKLL